MARPRFHKLAADQQETIVRVALAEFAAHGFADASLNRIIDAAGISKGSLYYYFDDKADLYAHVARRELEALIEREGPFPVPPSSEPDDFWTALTDYYTRLMKALLVAPQLAALIRGWVAAAGNPALQEVQREMEQTALPWFTQVIETGRQIGAIRTDLPTDLLLAVVLGMGQAMDLWLVGARSGELGGTGLPVEEVVPALIGMIRRALQP